MKTNMLSAEQTRQTSNDIRFTTRPIALAIPPQQQQKNGKQQSLWLTVVTSTLLVALGIIFLPLQDNLQALGLIVVFPVVQILLFDMFGKDSTHRLAKHRGVPSLLKSILLGASALAITCLLVFMPSVIDHLDQL